MDGVLLLALIGSFVGGLIQGLTGFGIALVFLMLFSLASSLGLSAAADLTYPVTLLTILSPLSSVTVLVMAWRKINWPLSIALSVGMGATWPFGMWLLLHANAFTVHTIMSVFFFVFSIWRLHIFYQQYRDWTQKNDSVANVDASPSLPISPEIKEQVTSTQNLEVLPVDFDEVIMDADGRIIVPIAKQRTMNTTMIVRAETPTETPTDSTSEISPASPPLSPAVIDPEDLLPPTALPRKQLFLSFVAGLFAGVFGGMLGAYGPPIMALFTVLPCHKHEIRASVCLMGFLILPLRIYLAIDNHLFKADDWLVYLVVSAVCLIGCWLGDRALAFINSKITMLSVINLLFVSSVSGMEFLGPAATPVLIIVVAASFWLWFKNFLVCKRVFV